MTVLVVVAWAFAIVILSAVSYRAIFTAAYLLMPSDPVDDRPIRQRKFLVVIPAHDEELLIADVIESLRAVDYPQELLDIHVIADNCSDQTAELAREADTERKGVHEEQARVLAAAREVANAELSSVRTTIASQVDEARKTLSADAESLSRDMLGRVIGGGNA